MNKIYRFIGKGVLKLLSLVCIILVTSVIVTSYYEDEKDEIFFKMYEYLHGFEERVVEDNGIIDMEDVQEVPAIKNI